ncbi:META domain protein [Tsuneonella dongtanensis]|uniref:META domain protein n=1 Tax=Tsuneonella dongtanensis TaxID=692370 RepID=A0A1B2AAN5_9SPHN|nr:META domain-containing protein [Tsuneonella dongtanensis]ANY19192.1 META domain protein [Tsuneonella dongtanensis]
MELLETIGRAAALLALPLLTGCMAAPSEPAPTSGPDTPVASTDAPARPAQGPLFGKWIVERVGTTDYPGDEAFVHFQSADFINHSGGCGGSQPAFYALDGDRITLTRREKPVVGKCPNAAYAARERALNGFLDTLVRWRKPLPGVLVLTAADGTEARLAIEAYPIPAIAGEWTVETIGGKPFGPASVLFAAKGVSARAECNTLYTEYALGPGGVRIEPGGAVTEIGCPPALQAQDETLFGALGQVTGHRIESGGRLVLTGGPGLVLRRAIPPAPL